MSLAILQARKSVYIPSAFCVGCVIVKDGHVLSTGFSRELPGNTHAEQCALDKLKDLQSAKGATMFTTMEPCSTRMSGNVPCVKRIIDAGICTVYQGVGEPKDFVACHGSEELTAAGIVVRVVPNVADECLSIARGQATGHLH